MSVIVEFIVDMVGHLGYIGIFIMMFLESSFFPFPSEIAMIPAGYLVYIEKMNIYFVLLSGLLGSIFGSLFNYYLAYMFGRNFLFKYRKFLFLTNNKIDKFEIFFKKHGVISTFIGRLLPAIRQYISFPAGLAKMNIWIFCLFTALGSFLWISILVYIGYITGEHEILVKKYINIAIICLLILSSVSVLLYIVIYKKIKNLKN